MGNEKAYIRAISYYLPSGVFSNEDFFREFPDVAAHSNFEKTGVIQRRIAEPGLTSGDLGIMAARNLFDEHKIDKSEIDFILFCSLEFDYVFPSTSNIIHKELELSSSCGTLDMASGCSGFPYALSFAKGLIESSGLKNVLIINSSTLTRLIHPKDKASRFLFGDAASATLISERKEKQGIGKFIFGTEGKKFDQIIVKDGAARHPISESSFVQFEDDNGNITDNAHLYMNGFSVFNFGLSVVPRMIEDVLKKNGLEKNDIDLFIFHQANLFLIDSICKKAAIPTAKVFNYIENTGNTVSASIPITICEAQKAGRMKTGSKVLLAAFGVGLSWSATILDV